MSQWHPWRAHMLALPAEETQRIRTFGLQFTELFDKIDANMFQLAVSGIYVLRRVEVLSTPSTETFDSLQHIYAGSTC